MRLATRTIVCNIPRLSHTDVIGIASDATATEAGATVVLDLSAVKETETAALAGLVLLRRALLAKGGDLFLRGIRARFAGLYRISRMTDLLPLVA